MMRAFVILTVIVSSVGCLLSISNPVAFASVKGALIRVTDKALATNPSRAVEIERSDHGEFSLQAKINGVSTPMVIDTGATSVVLTYETAKAAGLPLELLDYNVDVETAGGRVRAARLTLDRLSVGKLVERSVPALVVPRGQMKSNLLGMSFLNRLESWEVRADKLMMRGYP
ncbi:MAG: TIGR02281 family clan AA aspartic protease [Pseudomonadota bacterium]